MIDQKTKHSAHIPRRLVLLYYKIVVEEYVSKALEGSTETLCLTTIDRSIWFTLLFGSHLERGGAINTKYLRPWSGHPAPRMIAIDVPAECRATGATHSQIG